MTDRLLHADRTLPGTARPRYVGAGPGSCSGCNAKTVVRTFFVGSLTFSLCVVCRREFTEALVPGLRSTELDLVR